MKFLVLCRFSGVQATGVVYMGEFHSNKTRARAVVFVSMFMTASIPFMSVVGWVIIPMKWSFNIFGMIYRPWRLFILCNSSINIFAFIGLMMLPESPKFELAMGKVENTLDTLKTIYQYNTGNKKEVWTEIYTMPIQ